MRFRSDESDYEPVTRPRRAQAHAQPQTADTDWLGRAGFGVKAETVPAGGSAAAAVSAAPAISEGKRRKEKPKPIFENWRTTKGHTLSFVALFLYTAIAYFRPYELSSALDWTIKLPYWMAIGMLLIFIPSQIVAEDNLTARPKEVNLVLLLGLIALLSIPQAIDPALAWDTFYTLYFKTILVFIVMVNALRTEKRLRAMILLSLIAGGIMSLSALSDFATGKTGVYESRATAGISNMFGEPNSLAMHLVMMIPIALTLALSSSNVVKKLLYFGGCLVMIAGVFATYSRGGFLGLVAVGFVLAWKLGRKNRSAIIGILLLAVIAAWLFAPGGYGTRIGSIIDPSSESSAAARQALLTKSFWVGIASPILGVGIGNLKIVLIHDQVSHNAYTQVAGDMGLIALTLYLMFLIVPIRRLAAIERQTLREEHHSRYYYLAVALQVSLVGYIVSSFFLSVAYEWYAYFLVAYAVAFRRLYQRHVMQGKSATVPEPSPLPKLDVKPISA